MTSSGLLSTSPVLWSSTAVSLLLLAALPNIKLCTCLGCVVLHLYSLLCLGKQFLFRLHPILEARQAFQAAGDCSSPGSKLLGGRLCRQNWRGVVLMSCARDRDCTLLQL